MKTVEENLPPGWIREIKIDEKGGKIWRDALSAEAKGQRLIDRKADKSLSGLETIKSGSKVAAPKKADTAEGINVAEQRDSENYSVAGSLLNKLAQVNEKERYGGGRRQSKRLADRKLQDSLAEDQSLQSGSECAEEKNVNMTNCLEVREKENNSTGDRQNGNQGSQNKRKNSRRKRTSDLPHRTSKRLACVEVHPSLEVNIGEKVGADASRLSSEADINSPKNISEAGLAGHPEIDAKSEFAGFNDSNERSSKCRTEIPDDDNQKKSIHHGNCSSLEEHKGVGVHLRECEMHEEPLDSSLNDLLMDPCIEFAIKTLTGAIPIEDVSKVGDTSLSPLASPSSSLASVNIWADPCFEFAVKTLTAKMPASQAQITLQQQPLSLPAASGHNSLTLPKFRLDDISPSFKSQSDPVRGPYM